MDAQNVAADGEVGSIGFGEGGVDYGIVTDISPVSPKSYSHIYHHDYSLDQQPPEHLAKSLEEQFGRVWVENWKREWIESNKELAKENVIEPRQEYEIYSWLFDGWNQSAGTHNVQYILSCVKQVTFEDGSVWENEDYKNWLAKYNGKVINIHN